LAEECGKEASDGLAEVRAEAAADADHGRRRHLSCRVDAAAERRVLPCL